MTHVAKVIASWVKVAYGRNHTLFHRIEGIYVQQMMWHNQTEQVMRPYNPQGWSRHWQNKCTPLIHHLWSCHWEWIIPRSGKGLRTHYANLSTPPCSSYVVQAKPSGNHSPMATCQACDLQSNDNQHSHQLHWSLHWNHQSVKYYPQDLESCQPLQQCYQTSLHQHMGTLWVEHTLQLKTTVQPPSVGTTSTTWCHLCSISIRIHSLTMSHSQIL